MRLLHPTHLLARDYLVIAAHGVALEEAGETPPEICMHLLEKELQGAKPTPEEDLVPVPYYEVVAGRETDPTAFRFVDPPFTGPAIPYPEVLERQSTFLCLQAAESLKRDVSGTEPAAGALARTVLERRADRGDISAKVLADVLHQHRWSGGGVMAGKLFSDALLAPSLDGEKANEAMREKAANPRFFAGRLTGVRQGFEDANREATSLTDWVERLYRLLPELQDITRYLQVSELEGLERRLAFVESLDRKIGASMSASRRFAEAAVLRPTEAPFYFVPALEAARLDGNGKALAELLDELYQHQRSIPRFWYEAARDHLDSHPDRSPALLRDIDPYRIVSIDCLEEWSGHWAIKFRVLMAVGRAPRPLPELVAPDGPALDKPVPATRDPGPLPHPSRLRRRDYRIIRAGVEHFSLQGIDSPPPLWTALSQAEPDLEVLPLEDDFVNVPRVWGRYNEERDVIMGLSFDPPWNGGTESYRTTLEAQVDWFNQMATRHQIGGERRADQRRAFRTLSQFLYDEGEMRGGEYARGLVDRWHAHRWSPGGRLTGLLLRQCVTDPNRPTSARTSERVQIENNGTLINEGIKRVQRQIDEAKDTVTNLTEWAEALYRIHPYLQEVLLMLEVSEGANAEAWHERFQKFSNQFIDVSALNINAAIRNGVSRRGSDTTALPTWTTTYLDDVRRDEGTTQQTRQRLEYLYQKEVTFPRFWYELALEHVDTPVERMPSTLTSVDAYRAASIDVLECWSAQFMITLGELSERAAEREQ